MKHTNLSKDSAVEVGICKPPAAPIINFAFNVPSSSTILGDMEDWGLFPGAMLFGELTSLTL